MENDNAIRGEERAREKSRSRCDVRYVYTLFVSVQYKRTIFSRTLTVR